MERLTARNQLGLAYLKNVKPNEQDVESPYPNTLQCILESFNKLATYEDTGKTPEQVAEWAKTEQEGRLVVLPCKVGDAVYRAVTEWEGKECLKTSFKPYVEKFKVGAFYINIRDEIIVLKKFDELFVFGKTVFLTREAAEAALKEREKNDRN